jgi:hypothetical protein
LEIIWELFGNCNNFAACAYIAGMNYIRFIFSRFTALLLAVNLLVAVCGVPLQYCFCGDEISMVKIAMTVESKQDADCSECATCEAMAEQSEQAEDRASYDAPCCHSQTMPSAEEDCSTAPSSNTQCHREFHVEQLHTNALLSSIALPSDSTVIVAVLPSPSVEAHSVLTHSSLYALLANPPPLHGGVDAQALLCSLLI